MSALQAGRGPPPPSLRQLYRTHGVQAHDRSLETRRISIAGKPAGWQGSDRSGFGRSTSGHVRKATDMLGRLGQKGDHRPGPFRRNVRNLFGFLAVVVWIFFVVLPTPRTSHNLPHDCRQAFAGACTQAKAALPSAAFVSRASPHCERTAFGDDHTADALSCSVVTLSERACNTQQLHFPCVRLIALAPPIRGPPASV